MISIKNIVALVKQLFNKSSRINRSPELTNQNPQKTPVSQPVKKIIEELPPQGESSKTEKGKWHIPTHQDHFAIPSQPYLQEDWKLYGKFGYHTGVDYGGHGKTGLPLFVCADGEIIYREIADSAWGRFLGNHAVVYVPAVDKSFLYCHMADEPHALGPIKAGEQIGVMGNTGKSAGGAIHLHLEGFHGRFEIVWRSFKSLDDIKTKTFDADEFIRSRLV